MELRILARDTLVRQNTQRAVSESLRRSRNRDFWREDRTIGEILPDLPLLEGKTFVQHLYTLRANLDRQDAGIFGRRKKEPTPLRVLDIGCGNNATLLRSLAAEHPALHLELVGVTLADNQATPPADLPENITLVHDEITHYLQTQGQNKFQAIISIATFEHLADPWYTLEQTTNTLLEPNGIFFATGISTGIRPLVKRSIWDGYEYAGPDDLAEDIREQGYKTAIIPTPIVAVDEEKGQHVLPVRGVTVALQKPKHARPLEAPYQLATGIDISSLPVPPLINDGIAYLLRRSHHVGRGSSFTRGYGA